MIKKINSIRVPEELKILRTKGYTVVGIPDELKQLINDLAETCMSHQNCVGLTACQIWDDPVMPPPAIFVLRMKEGVLPYINPVVEKAFKKERDMFEQCMSVPGNQVKVTRPYHVMVRYNDGEGTERTQHLYDIMARVWLHEYDHIMGKLITDYGR